MPDEHNFAHLPNWGVVEVRCIEEGCDAGGPLRQWPEVKRRRHARAHAIKREQQLQRERLKNLSRARKLRSQAKRENKEAHG